MLSFLVYIINVPSKCYLKRLQEEAENMMVEVNISELRVCLARRGYSLRSFARESKISISYLSLIMNEKAMPSPKMAKRIADSLNVDIEDLFTFEYKEA